MKKFVVCVLKNIRYFIYRFIFKRQFKNYVLKKGVTLHKIGPFPESLFGYYNISPENKEHNVLVSEIKKDKLLIYLYHKSDYTRLASTPAWNYQQGCMLQWGLNTNNIYFNDFDSSTKLYVTRIISFESLKNVGILSKPICAINKEETFALSINFERLAMMRPDYGYFCKEVLLPQDSEDGLWYINLSTKEIKLIVSIEDLKNFHQTETMLNAKHKINHVDISPDGKRIMFLHRWIGPCGRFTRLITANIDGSNLYLLNGDKMTSHSCWRNNNTIISFCYTPEFQNSYVEFEDLTNIRRKVSDFLPINDGHPSVSPDGKWMVIDTYPMNERMSDIILYNFKTQKSQMIGRFYQPLKYVGSYRIDLHPKWSIDGNSIYFESGHNSKRNLYKINVSNIINEI